MKRFTQSKTSSKPSEPLDNDDSSSDEDIDATLVEPPSSKHPARIQPGFARQSLEPIAPEHLEPEVSTHHPFEIFNPSTREWMIATETLRRNKSLCGINAIIHSSFCQTNTEIQLDRTKLLDCVKANTWDLNREAWFDEQALQLGLQYYSFGLRLRIVQFDWIKGIYVVEEPRLSSPTTSSSNGRMIKDIYIFRSSKAEENQEVDYYYGLCPTRPLDSPIPPPPPPPTGDDNTVNSNVYQINEEMLHTLLHPPLETYDPITYLPTRKWCYERWKDSFNEHGVMLPILMANIERLWDPQLQLGIPLEYWRYLTDKKVENKGLELVSAED